MSFYSYLPTIGSSEGGSQLHPSIFEIISSKEVDDLLPQSARYILVQYWVSRHPSRLALKINQWFEEWFNLGLRGLVEWCHIDKYNSSYVDNFYGLRWFNTANKLLLEAQVAQMDNFTGISQDGSTHSMKKQWPLGLQLTKTQRKIVLIQKILLPYLQNKLQSLHTKLVAEAAFGLGTDHQNKLTDIYIKLYPIWQKCARIMTLVIQLCFLTGKTSSFTLLEFLFKIGHTRSMLPLERNGSKLMTTSSNRKQIENYYQLRNKGHKLMRQLLQVLSFAGSQAFPAFIFNLRVYQWWITEDIGTKLKRKQEDIDEDIPRPPTTPNQPRSSEYCPICKKLIQNPCILETGYVTCYPCAMDYLANNEGKCPVTKKKLLGCEYDSSVEKWVVLGGVRRLLI